MAGKDKKVINMNSYQKKGTWNIGIVLFGVIFVYLIITVLIYLTKDRIAIYEVREGSILKNTSFTGIALRDEQIVYSNQSGYVNYFVDAGQKVAVGSNVYTITPNEIKDTASAETNEEVDLSSDEWNNILMKVQSFNENFRLQNFSDARTLKEETTALLQSNTNQNRVTQLNSLLNEGSIDGMQVFQTSDDGIIEYSYDGYENLQMEDITGKEFAKSGYTQTELLNNTKISSGTPVYRLITSEEWSLVFKLTKEIEDMLYEKMEDSDTLYVKIRFDKDNKTMRGNLRIFNKGEDDSYGYIKFTDSMIRYAKDRYLDIELILEDESGLKIPKSAVIEKEFYLVPEDYLTTGGSSSDMGVLRQTKNKKDETIVEFKSVNVFYRDKENGMVYLNPDDFQNGDVLVKPESTETFSLHQKGKLQGVYNVNKGYAVFKQIKILCESEEYYIVEEGNSYGLSNYDHIALDSTSVQENDIVSQ
ncbi:MAG: HlyD family efflux transporter periplasmic adaptor subunit [Bariatricus sp.]|nr:HlyD family efflux transporter periplasmic adaptor subunit [Bariatricus sp.]